MSILEDYSFITVRVFTVFVMTLSGVNRPASMATNKNIVYSHPLFKL